MCWPPARAAPGRTSRSPAAKRCCWNRSPTRRCRPSRPTEAAERGIGMCLGIPAQLVAVVPAGEAGGALEGRGAEGEAEDREADAMQAAMDAAAQAAEEAIAAQFLAGEALAGEALAGEALAGDGAGGIS